MNFHFCVFVEVFSIFFPKKPGLMSNIQGQVSTFDIFLIIGDYWGLTPSFR